MANGWELQYGHKLDQMGRYVKLEFFHQHFGDLMTSSTTTMKSMRFFSLHRLLCVHIDTFPKMIKVAMRVTDKDFAMFWTTSSITTKSTSHVKGVVLNGSMKTMPIVKRAHRVQYSKMAH